MTIEITKYSMDKCRECKILANAMTEVDFAAHNATVQEIDVSGLSDSALTALGLQGVPTMIARRNGAIVARAKGAMAPEEIVDFITTAKEAR